MLFLSYPKAGRSWIRYTLHLLGVDQHAQFAHDQFEFNDGNCPPHNFDSNLRRQQYGNQPLVFIHRNPIDNSLSLYHQVTGRFKDFFNYQGTVSDFLRDDYFGIEVLLKFRLMWAELSQQLNVHCLSYEAVKQDPRAELTALLRFMKLSQLVTHQKLADAIEGASVDKMRQVEQSGSFNQPWLRPRNDHGKVRKGQVGSFLDELSADDIEFSMSKILAPQYQGALTASEYQLLERLAQTHNNLATGPTS